MNEYKSRELGQAAEQIVNNEVWQKSWAAVRDNCMVKIEQAASNDVETVMHFKRMLAAITAAKANIERYMNEGKISATFIEHEEKKSLKKRVFG